MRRVRVVLLATVVLLAGCPGDAARDSTVTAAPVPSPTPPASTAVDRVSPPADRATATCPVATPSRPTNAPTAGETPTGPATIPVENGSADASAVVDRHEATLREHRYRLTSSGLVVVATRNRSTMLVRSRASAAGLSHYVAEGRVHSYYYHRGGGSDRYTAGPYDGGPLESVRGTNLSLTGGEVIERTLTRYPHRVDHRRSNDWTVLRASIGNRTAVGDRTIYRVHSTVVIDRRGIVRSVDRRVLSATEENGTRRWSNRSVRVTDVGTATFERPHWVCLAPARQADGGS